MRNELPRLSRRFLGFISTGFLILAMTPLSFLSITGQSIKRVEPRADRIENPVERVSPALSPSIIIVPNGMAVVSGTGVDGSTLKLVDIRQFGNLWSTPSNRAPNYIASTGQMPLIQSWSASSFSSQAVRPVAVSGDGTRIYAGASGYPGGDKTPRVFIIGPASTTPLFLYSLPSYVGDTTMRKGVAGLDLDEVHNQVFASNFADGIIYRHDATLGTLLSQFDPLTPFPGGTTSNLPPFGERITAVAFHKFENRVYYGVWGYDTGTGTGTNTIRSVGLTAAGAFNPGTDVLEVTIAGSLHPALDIEFNNAGTKMLVAEEPLTSSATTIGLSAHQGRGLEYTGGTGTWTLDPTVYGSGNKKYYIGISIGTNSRGGAAWAYYEINTVTDTIIANESFVVFTGDALRLDSLNVYGIQYTPSSGGSPGSVGTSNVLIADLDYNVVGQDKFVYGDVDIRRTLNPSAAAVSISGRVLTTGGAGIAKATVILTNVQGETRTALTNPFGYYRFDGLRAGDSVSMTVSSKGRQFNTRVLTVDDDLTEVNFIALE